MNEKTPGGSDSSKGVRRVYVLPQELVDRILGFQREVGLSSEVEAARKLLDSALKSRDTAENIVSRLLDRLDKSKDIRDAAKELLIDHPRVTSIEFTVGEITFQIKDDGRFSVRTDGNIYRERSRDSWTQCSDPRVTGTLDGDDIPF